MAAKTWYLTATTANSWRTIDETPVTAANSTDGWVVAKAASNDTSSYYVGVKRAANTFSGATQPDGSLDLSNHDAFRTTSAYTGTFANANWVFNFVFRTTSASTQSVACVFRLFKGAAADGSDATEFATGQHTASTVGLAALTT